MGVARSTHARGSEHQQLAECPGSGANLRELHAASAEGGGGSGGVGGGGSGGWEGGGGGRGGEEGGIGAWGEWGESRTASEKAGKRLAQQYPWLGPPVVPFYPFLGEG